jgi:hypothetical protein
MAIKNGSASFLLSLEYTWEHSGTWADHPQEIWGPMLDVSTTVFDNTTQVNGSHTLGEPYLEASYVEGGYLRDISDNQQTILQEASAKVFRRSTISLTVSTTQTASAINTVSATATLTTTASISTGTKTRIRTSPVTLTAPTATVTVAKNILGPQATLTTQASMSVSAVNTVRGTITLSATASISRAGGGRIHASPNVSMSSPTFTVTVGRIKIIFRNLKRTYYIPAPKTTYTIQPLTRVNTTDAEIRSIKIPKLTRNIKVKEEIREYATNYRF